MDQPCSFEDLRACLGSIASVNRWTGAHAPTLRWLERMRFELAALGRPVQIVDVGCGYGDLLRRIHRWSTEGSVPVVLTGIDLNEDAVRAAREVTEPRIAQLVTGDAFAFSPVDGIDLVVSSLLTHHLEEVEIVRFLRWMEINARLGWFINDLHRQPVPYHAFRLLSRLTTWHRFVKHDGPVSILRSFRREDWVQLCEAAGLGDNSYRIREYRPARLCVERLR